MSKTIRTKFEIWCDKFLYGGNWSLVQTAEDLLDDLQNKIDEELYSTIQPHRSPPKSKNPSLPVSQ